MTTEEIRERRNRYLVRKTTLAEQDEFPDLENTTPSERIGMMWQLALDAWAFTGKPIGDGRLRKDLVPVYRNGRRIR